MYKKILSLVICGFIAFSIIGCGNKITSDEQSVIDCLEVIEKDIDQGMKRANDGKGEYKTYDDVQSDYKNCDVLKEIGDTKCDKVDETTNEYKVWEKITNAIGNLCRGYDESIWKEQKQIIKDTLAEYKKSIK